jgi:hypothetical protein
VTARAHAAAPALPTGSVTLHGGSAQVVLLPASGGRIVGLSFGGHQWLAPSSAASAPDLTLADGTDLCAAAPAFSLATTGDGQIARCVWDAGAAAVRAERAMLVRPDGTVVTQYTVHNRGRARVEFGWTSRVLHPLRPLTRLLLPSGIAATVTEVHRAAVGAAGASFTWPAVSGGEVTADLSRPYEAWRTDHAVRCALALPPAECVLALEQDGARLEIVVDGRALGQAEVWIDRHGFAARPRRRVLLPWRLAPGPQCVVALAPGTGYRWLEPGASASWHVTWRDGRVRGTP